MKNSDSPQSSIWLVGSVVGVVAIGILTLFLAVPKAVDARVVGGFLSVRKVVGHASFAPEQLDLEAASILRFSGDPARRSWRKVSGFSGFGFRSGRFLLGSQQEVELYFASEKAALLIPRQSNVPLVVGTNDPAALLTALRGIRQKPT